MNIRQVRKKIKSITNVKKITKAMEMISAIKMKKAQQKAVEGRPYQEGLDEMIKKIIVKVDISHSSLLAANDKTDKELIIIVSSNKGLCGGFNFNLFRFLLVNKIEFAKTDFIIVGKKSGFFINKMKGNILADFSSNEPLNSVSAVFDYALKIFFSRQCRKIFLVYNRFISALKVTPVVEMLLPFSMVDNKLQQIKQTNEYLIEPSSEKIIDSLLRSYLEERIRFSIIQSEAGEHSSRMIAMKNATDNAEDLTYSLTLLRNKIRQTKITYELLDMMTAKESVS